MKALPILIALLILPAETFAEASNQPIQLEQMNVEGLVDEELNAIERDLEAMKFYNRNGTKKVDKLNKYQQHFQELIPKQIELTKGRRKIQQLIDTKTKYIECLSKKEEEDCSDLKDDLDALNSSVPNIQNSKTFVMNRSVLGEMRQCSDVTREQFPDFKAIVRVDLYLDELGNVSYARLDQQKSASSLGLPLFNECVVHFSKKLQYHNPLKQVALVVQDFVFGIN